MNRIPLAQALDLIHDAVCVQVDESYVCFPMNPEDYGDDLCLMCAASDEMPLEDMDRFRTADNETVEATERGFVFIDVRGDKVCIMPLLAAPYKL